MQTIIIENATVLDVVQGKLLPDQRIVIEGQRFARVTPMRATEASLTASGEVYDARGMTVMPGLCDAHVHVTTWTSNLPEREQASPAYSTVRTIEVLEGMLMRGFTTVRDQAGADYGLAQVVQDGYLKGPRILFCGSALSSTGGHGDLRGREAQGVDGAGRLSLFRLCDGVAEMRRTCRDEIRKGAHHIKLMISGGIFSPTDRLTNDQFAEEEIRAAVEEAGMADIYCTGHAYTTRAVNRALHFGVRSLEHCNLIDESSVELFLQHKAFMTPTLSVYAAMVRESQSMNFPVEMQEKLHRVQDKGLQALELASRSGVKLVYGTDLVGKLHAHQLDEFKLRSKVQPAIDIIRSATCNAAELFNEVGQIGVLAAGARADLLVVDGNPLSDLGCLQAPDRCLKAIMKDGKFYKNALLSLRKQG